MHLPIIVIRFGGFILHLGPIAKEVRQRLRLDCVSPFIVWCVRRQLDCPFGNSDSVVQQSSGNWDALDANMALYRFHVQKISGFFEGCEYKHIPRLENEAGDILSKLGSSRDPIPPEYH